MNAAAADWQHILNERLPLLGHRNWIVVADSAYPAQTAPGIETVVSDANQTEVLAGVLSAINQSRHVRPIVYTDKELGLLTEQDAPGVELFRDRLRQMLGGKPAQSIPHLQLISKLDSDSKLFRILLIKTNSTIPYTTVFIQLDCAYWHPEQEKALRQRHAVP